MKIDLKKLSDAELVERFNEIAVEMGHDSDSCLTRSYSRRFEQMEDVVDELVSRDRLDALRPSMQDTDPWVRCFAAQRCREIASTESEKTLEEVGRIDYGTVGSEARTSLWIVRQGWAVPRSQRRPRSERS